MEYTLIVIASVFLFFVLFLGFFTVAQQTNAIVQRFGKFARVSKPGLNWKIPFIEGVAGRLNLKIQQLDVQVETKTKDNVFVNVVVSVQYFVLPERVYQAFYSLNNAQSQITSFVFDVVRAEVPRITLDNVFEKKDDIAVAIKEELTNVMDDFGYGIVKALVTDIDPDLKVKNAMNEINAAERMRYAATEKGEAEKILKVKQAEAEAESKILQGKGIAGQRKAIIEGLSESVNDFQKNIAGSNAKEVMNLVLITQYFDTMKDVAASSKTNTIMIPHSASYVDSISGDIRNAIITANEVRHTQ